MSNKAKRRLCTAVFVLSAIAFVFFALSFADAQKAYWHGDGDLEAVMEIRGETPPVLSEEVKSRMDEASLRAAEHDAAQTRKEGYERLKEKNQDVIGWISIEGTQVDYPVMHTPDEPDYYYHRGFDKKYSAYGMIYMDATCTIASEDSYDAFQEEENICPNYILYGHHMKNGAMFASLEEYHSKAYYDSHPVIRFDTGDSSGLYEIIGAVRIPAAKLNNEFAAVLAARSQEEYDSLIRYIKEQAFYDTGITAKWPKQLITLTTCEYTQKDGRFLVVAVKREQ